MTKRKHTAAKNLINVCCLVLKPADIATHVAVSTLSPVNIQRRMPA
jgi:hypothetical protein